MPDLLFDVTDRIATITLNRPERKNAFTAPMMDDWVAALHECQDSDAISVVILTGAGGAFCSGGDVDRMNRNAEAGEEKPLDQKNYIWKGINRVPRLVQALDKPYLVAVNGVAAGAGMDMALMGDIIFAAESARFGETYIRVGLIPADGGGWYLPRLVGMQKALELFWTGDMISAAEAARIGMVNRVIADDQLMTETRAFAERLASGPALAIQMTKRSCYQAMEMDLITHLDLVTSHQPVLKATEDHKEAVRAFVEKRKPVFGGR